MPVLVLLAVAAALAVVPSAHAASVSATVVPPECDEGGCGGPQRDVMRFVADAGEVNDLRVGVSAERVIFQDISAPLMAGEGCERLADGRVACRIVPNRSLGVEVDVTAALGDQADRAAIEGVARRAVRLGQRQLAAADDPRLTAAR